MLVLDEILQNLLTFNRSSILKKGVFMFMANFFDLRMEKRTIQKYFNEVDKDNSGTLSFEELVVAYTFKVRF